MDHSTLRAIHIGCAGISISLFVIRSAMQGVGFDWRRSRWLRTVPHVNDTVLLGAAIALAVTTSQYPFAQSWLTAKVVALCAYVALGRVALRRGAPPRTQALAFAAAVTSVAYIVGVAMTRSAHLGLI